jgi:hypothetical protein
MATNIESVAKQSNDDAFARTARMPASPSARKGWLARMVNDIFFVAKRDKKWLLLPLILLLLILTALFAMAMLAGPLAPFVYPIL